MNWKFIWNWFRPRPKPPAPVDCLLTVLAPERTHIAGLSASAVIETAPPLDPILGVDSDRVHFRIPADRRGHGALVTLAAPGYLSQAQRREMVPEMGETIMQPAVSSVSAWPAYADGLVLRTASGAPSFVMGLTAFPLLRDVRDGASTVGPFLDFCQRYGLMPRSLGCYDGGLGRFVPDGREPAALDALLTELARRGLGLKLSILADFNRSADLNAAVPDQQAYVDSLAEVCQGHQNVLPDLGNEFPFNGWDPQAFSRPVGPLWSRGSNGMDAPPPSNPWECFDLHTRRDQKWYLGLKDILDIQIGANGASKVPVAGGTDEPVSIGETPNEDGKFCVTDPALWFDFVAAPFGSYVVNHVRAGLRLDVPGPVATQCIEAGNLAAAALPAEFREGIYVRSGPSGGDFGLVDSPASGDPDSPDWWRRAYGRMRGNDQWVTIIAQTPAFRPEFIRARPGWKIVSMTGLSADRPSLVHLVRD